MRKFASALGLLLLMALLFVGLVLTGDQGTKEREAPASLPAVGSAQGNDLNTLTAVFGCPVPCGSRTGTGLVTDAAIGSLRARTLTWQGNDGLVTTAVRPVEAASLLRREGFPLDDSNLWTLGSVTLMLSASGEGVCAYYQTEDAAFCLYRADTDTDAFLTLIASGVDLLPNDQP